MEEKGMSRTVRLNWKEQLLAEDLVGMCKGRAKTVRVKCPAKNMVDKHGVSVSTASRAVNGLCRAGILSKNSAREYTFNKAEYKNSRVVTIGRKRATRTFRKSKVITPSPSVNQLPSFVIDFLNEVSEHLENFQSIVNQLKAGR